MASPDPNPVTDTDGEDPTRPQDEAVPKGDGAEPSPAESAKAQPLYPN